MVEALGGLAGIAISHPHYYTTMVEWSRAFGGVPIWLHEDEREWVMRPDPAVRFWRGETQALGDGLTLLRLGGHFQGAQVLHWAGGADGKGVVLAGDVLQVVQDRRFVSFMYSYPNYTPLPAATVRRHRAPRSSPTRSSGSTAPGSTPWCGRTARRRSRARSSAICGRSVRRERVAPKQSAGQGSATGAAGALRASLTCAPFGTQTWHGLRMAGPAIAGLQDDFLNR